MRNPYQNVSDFQMWSRAVSDQPPSELDLMVNSIKIEDKQKVATMGSCFAQHIAMHLKTTGRYYYVAEKQPSGMSEVEASRRNYGIFSARFGNVYTVRQALQLFQRAFGEFRPLESVWRRGSAFVDPYRPQIEPEGFPCERDVGDDRSRHLSSVKRMFVEADWLVFTLGLTEAWRSKADGAVFPLAPGVAGGSYNPTNHEFVNFTLDETRADLFNLINNVRRVNSGIKFILTVSPVPLIATYEPRHIVMSTTVSKAILRIAADEAERHFENVVYFPSYELIASQATSGQYYEDDLREVRRIGVKHVMRMFDAHFFDSNKESEKEVQPLGRHYFEETQGVSEIVCDEEEIERSLWAGGSRHES